MLLSLQLLQRLFIKPAKEKKNKKRKKSKGDRFLQSLVLEPILTPSALLDTPNDPNDDLDVGGDDGDVDAIADDSGDDATATDDATPLAPASPDGYEASPWITADDVEYPGTFIVGDTGEVRVDFLFDGGAYRGEVAIFSVEGMEDIEIGSQEFIRIAAERALSESDSKLGHIVIQDVTEGAKFSNASYWEGDFNSGDYQGVKTVTMNSGDRFAIMLVPDGTVQQVFDDPDIGGNKTPLFSLDYANPEDGTYMTRMTDVTGDGNTFAMEDWRLDANSDRDYNDVVFQIRGAKGDAPLMDDMVDPARDWRATDLGQELLSYVSIQAGLDGTQIELDYDLQEFIFLREEVWDNSENYQHFLETFSRVDDNRFDSTIDLLQNYLNQDDPDLEGIKEQLIEQIPGLTEALSDPENQELVELLEANIISFNAGEMVEWVA